MTRSPWRFFFAECAAAFEAHIHYFVVNQRLFCIQSFSCSVWCFVYYYMNCASETSKNATRNCSSLHNVLVELSARVKKKEFAACSVIARFKRNNASIWLIMSLKWQTKITITTIVFCFLRICYTVLIYPDRYFVAVLSEYVMQSCSSWSTNLQKYE